LPSISNYCNSHVYKIKISVLWKLANSNLVDFLVGLNFRFKQAYGTKTRKGKNNNTKDHPLDVPHVLPLVAMLGHLEVCILPNRFVVPGCGIVIRIT
jgi:hypothetical protein